MPNMYACSANSLVFSRMRFADSHHSESSRATFNLIEKDLSFDEEQGMYTKLVETNLFRGSFMVYANS